MGQAIEFPTKQPATLPQVHRRCYTHCNCLPDIIDESSMLRMHKQHERAFGKRFNISVLGVLLHQSNDGHLLLEVALQNFVHLNRTRYKPQMDNELQRLYDKHLSQLRQDPA